MRQTRYWVSSEELGCFDDWKYSIFLCNNLQLITILGESVFPNAPTKFVAVIFPSFIPLTLYPFRKQILLVLLWKYIETMATSHHLHSYHFDPNHHQL